MAARDNDDIADLIDPLIALRRDIHREPELGFEEHRTAARIGAALRVAGIEVHEGIGGTGIVGVLRHGMSDRTIGLRADMDALPMEEQTNLPYASVHQGRFHGCGHDGHVAMLLGAARHLARTRAFDGTVHFIFQPAEEGLGGAGAMIRDGLFDRFPCDRVFALHNWPTLPAGTVATRPGPIMAAADRFTITLTGKGAHAAMPHLTPDVLVAASDLVLQLNTIVSRRVPAQQSAVLSVTEIHGGETHNVMPAVARVTGTVRTFDPAVQDLIERAIRQIAAGVAAAAGVDHAIEYIRYYPATINDPAAAQAALDAAATVCHAELADQPAFTSEDFGLMLQARPGAYLWLGQGRQDGGDSRPLHHPGYDFNDNVLAIGVLVHLALVAHHLPLSAG